MSEDKWPDISISVITVVRNGIEFIEQTICSVLEQTYPNLEYIVIDGLSLDGTIDVIKSYDSKIAYWLSEKDNGIADAFNKGLAASTGQYVLFLNADDKFANPDVVQEIAKKIQQLNFPALVYGDCDVLNRSTGEVLYRASIELPQKKLLRGAMIPQPSLFTHRSYFDKYGGFDPNFKIAMDYEWLLRGGLTERMVHVPLLVTCVRNGGISTINQKCVVDEIVCALKKNGHISSKWGEVELRGYFLGRSLAKAILDSLGLYKVFAYFRNNRRIQDYQ